MNTETGCRDLDRGLSHGEGADESCDLGALRPGDHLEAWEDQMLRYTGTVDVVAPALRVVWIREAGIGSRKMLSVHQYRLRTGNPSAPGDSRSTVGRRCDPVADDLL